MCGATSATSIASPGLGRHAPAVSSLTLKSVVVVTLKSVVVVTLALTVPAYASRFEDLGPSLGLPLGTPGSSLGKSLVAAISAADIDGDGDIDLIASEPLRGLTVYLREGPIYRAAPEWTDGLRVQPYGHTLFDMDGDGDLDLYLARDEGELLFENQGTKLVDVTASRLPVHPGWAFTATAVDLDGDQDLDLLVARYIDRVGFPAHRCLDNLVLDNDGHGRFRDITAASGLRGTRGCSFVTLAFDLDQDRDLDLFTINDFSQFAGPNEIWRNVGRDDDGHPHFVEVSRELGFDAPVYGMGLAIADLDQNGQLDFFVTNIGEPLLFELEGNRFADFANEPGAGGHFFDSGSAHGLRVRYGADRNIVTWTALALDLDRDGYLDLLLASGELSSADFIGNGPELQTLWLRGRPDGSLVAQAPVDAFDVPGSSTRDFAFVDVDDDARPEVVAIHMHGGISVLRDRLMPPPPTELTLIPSTTAAGAAGAEVVLTCGGITRTRHVVGGGDYGNADLGLVSVAFPAPCDGVDHPLSGQVRWPSGYVQALTASSGHTARIIEDPWLLVSDAALTVDLSHHADPFFAVTPHAMGLVLGPPEVLGERHWRWSLADADATREGTITLALDGRPMGIVARVGRPSIEVWFDPASPSAGRSVRVSVRFAVPVGAASVRFTGGPEVPLAPGEGDVLRAELVAPAEGPSALAITSDEGGDAIEEVIPIRVSDPISDERSELVVRDLQVATDEVSFRRVRLRLRLRDENNLPSAIPFEELAVKIDGVLYESVERAYDGDIQALVIPHLVLHHGARLQVVAQGRDRFPEQLVVQLAAGDELGSLVATGPGARSFCALSEPRLVADGVDRGTVLVQLFDAQGTRLPDLGQTLLAEGDGVTVLPGDVRPGYGGWAVAVRAGNVARLARMSARVAGQTTAVSCDIPLVAPGPSPPIAPSSPLVPVFGEPRLDVPATLRFVPQGPDGRAVGSGAAFHFEVLGADVDPIIVLGAATYVGLGRYELIFTPRLLSTIVVSAIAPDARVLATRSFVIADPNAEEAGPEAVEAGPELVEAVELDDDIQPEAEAEPDTFFDAADTTAESTDAEPAAGDADPADEATDEVVLPDVSDASAAEPEDTAVGLEDAARLDITPDAAPDAAEPSGTEVAHADAAADPSKPASRDASGCGNDPSATPTLVLATASLLAFRRRLRRW